MLCTCICISPFPILFAQQRLEKCSITQDNFPSFCHFLYTLRCTKNVTFSISNKLDFNKNYFLPYIRTLGIVKAIFDHDDNLGVERLPDPNKGICLEEAALHLNLVVEEGIEDNNDQESLPSRNCCLSNCKIESHKSLRPYDNGNFGNYQTIVIHLNAMNYQPYNLCRKYTKKSVKLMHFLLRIRETILLLLLFVDIPDEQF